MGWITAVELRVDEWFLGMGWIECISYHVYLIVGYCCNYLITLTCDEFLFQSMKLQYSKLRLYNMSANCGRRIWANIDELDQELVKIILTDINNDN